MSASSKRISRSGTDLALLELNGSRRKKARRRHGRSSSIKSPRTSRPSKRPAYRYMTQVADAAASQVDKMSWVSGLAEDSI